MHVKKKLCFLQLNLAIELQKLYFFGIELQKNYVSGIEFEN